MRYWLLGALAPVTYGDFMCFAFIIRESSNGCEIYDRIVFVPWIELCSAVNWMIIAIVMPAPWKTLTCATINLNFVGSKSERENRLTNSLPAYAEGQSSSVEYVMRFNERAAAPKHSDKLSGTIIYLKTFNWLRLSRYSDWKFRQLLPPSARPTKSPIKSIRQSRHGSRAMNFNFNSGAANRN